MKYEVNRVTVVGNVGEVPRVSERDGEEVRRTEWHQSVVDVVSIRGHLSR